MDSLRLVSADEAQSCRGGWSLTGIGLDGKIIGTYS